MAADNDRITTEPDDLEPTTDADELEDDTSGHSMATYEYARQHARAREREAEDWAKKEAVRKEARSLRDRLRGR